MDNPFVEVANPPPSEQTLLHVHRIICTMLDLEKNMMRLRIDARYIDRNLAHFSWAQLQAADRRVREGDEELDHLTERRDALLRQVPLRDLMITCQHTVPPEDFFDERASAIHRIYIEAVEARMHPALAFIGSFKRPYGYVPPTLEEVQKVLAPLMDEWLAFSQEHHDAFGNYTPQRIAQLHARFHAALRALEEAHALAVLSATNKRLGADARLSILPPDVLSNIVSQTFQRK
jgi:hypothetical protein